MRINVSDLLGGSDIFFIYHVIIDDYVEVPSGHHCSHRANRDGRLLAMDGSGGYRKTFLVSKVFDVFPVRDELGIERSKGVVVAEVTKYFIEEFPDLFSRSRTQQDSDIWVIQYPLNCISQCADGRLQMAPRP